MKKIVLVVVGVGALAAANVIRAEEPTKSEDAPQKAETSAQKPEDAEITALRAKVAARAKADVDEYGRDGVRAIEMAYRAYSRSKDVDNEHLRTLIEKYPKANRTGCAVMYAGQRAQGSDDGKWFRLAMEKYADCMYGDGVQVGAYARLYLAGYLESKGKKDEAKKLRGEILKLYPDARTHRGRKMSEFLDVHKEGLWRRQDSH